MAPTGVAAGAALPAATAVSVYAGSTTDSQRQRQHGHAQRFAAAEIEALNRHAAMGLCMMCNILDHSEHAACTHSWLYLAGLLLLARLLQQLLPAALSGAAA
jgi:hypothetical protein